MTTDKQYRPMVPGAHPRESAWQIARLTELALMGHSYRSIRNVLNVSKQEYDHLLDAAVNKADAEQRQIENEVAEESEPPSDRCMIKTN